MEKSYLVQSSGKFTIRVENINFQNGKFSCVLFIRFKLWFISFEKSFHLGAEISENDPMAQAYLEENNVKI